MQNKKQELLERIRELEEKLTEKWNEETSYNWDYSAVANDIKEEVWDEIKEQYEEKIEGIKMEIEEPDDIVSIEVIETRIDDLEYEIDNLEIDVDLVNEKVNDYFIYYSDAWEYLQDNDITDFSDAFDNGCTQVCEIAAFYLSDEFWGY